MARMGYNTKAETLAPIAYMIYGSNWKIEKKLSVGAIYSLSTTEQEVLKEFIHNNGFICPTSFSHRVSILFVKRKDSSLYLYINFQELNCII